MNVLQIFAQTTQEMFGDVPLPGWAKSWLSFIFGTVIVVTAIRIALVPPLKALGKEIAAGVASVVSEFTSEVRKTATEAQVKADMANRRVDVLSHRTDGMDNRVTELAVKIPPTNGGDSPMQVHT